MKKNTIFTVLFVFFILLLIALSMRIFLGGNEDAWICDVKNSTWIKHGNPDNPMPNEQCGNKIVKTNFLETGHLVKKEEAGLWQILYEKPGIPVITKVLSITQNSLCVNSGIQSKCDETNFLIGKSIKVDGYENNELVEVNSIEFFEQ